MSTRRIQYTITLGALLMAIAHALFPGITIDAITLSLIVVAIVPWLGPVFKSVELPGGVKVEYQQKLEEAAQRAGKAGLLSTVESRARRQYSFQLVAEEDPNLALAGLRIELERQLKALAEAVGVGTSMQGARRLVTELWKQGALSEEERSVLADLLDLLNDAVHGVAVDHRASTWAMDIGPRLLESLQGKEDSPP